jgi:serine/threonine protein kinase
MGEVYRARDSRLDRSVAIKLLRSETVGHPDRKWRFVREAKAASALNHPGIVTVYDVGEAQGLDYIAMELVEGEPLDRRIPARGLPIETALDWALQAAEALGAAHGAGLVHRDFKPSNILISPSGRLKVLDFGLAKLADSSAAPGEADSRLATVTTPVGPRTAAGVVLGTPAYMSPEQATEGARLDGRSDVYSLACVIYEMLAGEQLFAGPTPHEAIARRLRHPRPALERLPAGVPRALRHTLERALAVAPAERFPTAGDLARAVAESSSAGPVVRLGAALARLTSAALRVSPNRKGGGRVPEAGCPIRRAD